MAMYTDENEVLLSAICITHQMAALSPEFWCAGADRLCDAAVDALASPVDISVALSCNEWCGCYFNVSLRYQNVVGSLCSRASLRFLT